MQARVAISGREGYRVRTPHIEKNLWVAPDPGASLVTGRGKRVRAYRFGVLQVLNL